MTQTYLNNVFYIASYFGKGIYVERLANQNSRLVAPVK